MWRTKCSEGHGKGKLGGERIFFGHIGTRGVRPLMPSRLSLRLALWTRSTSGKPLHAYRWTTSPLYTNMEFQPVVTNNKNKVLLLVLGYCPGSTATRYSVRQRHSCRYRGTDREEMESGPSKTAAQRRFCWVRPDCLHWEVKQETYLEVRNAKHR